jgi:hypothetical protein
MIVTGNGPDTAASPINTGYVYDADSCGSLELLKKIFV